jgi:hypothetical protein
MISAKREAPPWTKDSAALFKQFCESGVGQLFLATVISGRPSLLSGQADLEATALQAREVAGYERAVNLILSLMEPPIEAPSETENYPPLDDDSKWEKKPE